MPVISAAVPAASATPVASSGRVGRRMQQISAPATQISEA